MFCMYFEGHGRYMNVCVKMDFGEWFKSLLNILLWCLFTLKTMLFYMSSMCLSKSIWCTKSNFIYTSNLMLVVSEYQFTLTKIQCTAIGTTHLCSYSVIPIKDQERWIKIGYTIFTEVFKTVDGSVWNE